MRGRVGERKTKVALHEYEKRCGAERDRQSSSILLDALPTTRRIATAAAAAVVETVGIIKT